MEERLDELKGSVKEGAGKVTGNRDLEAEGRGERTVAETKRNVKGAANQVKGKIERGVGNLTDDDSTRAQGALDETKGTAQRNP